MFNNSYRTRHYSICPTLPYQFWNNERNPVKTPRNSLFEANPSYFIRICKSPSVLTTRILHSLSKEIGNKSRTHSRVLLILSSKNRERKNRETSTKITPRDNGGKASSARVSRKHCRISCVHGGTARKKFVQRR